MYTVKNYVWDDPPIFTLGIYVDTNFEKMCELNINPLIEQVKNTLLLWPKRPLTLLGKVLIVNSLIESLMVYRFSMTPVLNETKVSQIQMQITNFIWNGKRPKISFEILKAPKEQGGLRWVDLHAKHCVMLAQWVFLIDNDKFLMASCYDALNVKLGADIWLINMKSSEVSCYFRNSFWMHVLEAWCKCSYLFPMTSEEVRSQFLWFNSHIVINKKTVFHVRAYDRGCKFVRDLLGEEDIFLNYCDFIKKFSNSLSWLDYEGLIKAIPTRWKNILEYQVQNTEIYEHMYVKLKNVKQSKTKIMYCNLMSRPLVAVNSYNNCNFCTEQDSIEHTLYYCENIQKIWQRWEKETNDHFGTRIKVDIEIFYLIILWVVPVI